MVYDYQHYCMHVGHASVMSRGERIFTSGIKPVHLLAKYRVDVGMCQETEEYTGECARCRIGTSSDSEDAIID